MPPSPTIHSFFKPISSSTPNNTPSYPGDGFTPTDPSADSSTDPLYTPFAPTRTYTQHAIVALTAGSRPVRFQGRVANFRVTYGKSKRVKLYFSPLPPPLHLTQLITIYTPHLVRASSLIFAPSPSPLSPPTTPCTPLQPPTPLGTSIFPGRDSGVHLILHPPTSSPTLYRTPLSSPTGQMTLSSFLTSGHELPAARLLLVLTAIHPSRKVHKKDPPSPGHPARMTDFVVSELVLADRTGECKLTLFDHATVPFKVGTVLLITGATMKRGGEKACISLGQESLVDAEPEVKGVEVLRRWAEKGQRLSTKRQEIPDKVMEKLEETVGEAGLYTLAELEERVREEEGGWTLWLSLVVGQLNLVRVVRRGMAGVGECCGIPIYSPEPTAPCLTCGTIQTLSINPAIIGLLLDETGALEAEKLQWMPKAWKELLGEAGAMGILGGNKEAEDAAAINEIREMQQRITGLRFSFLMGWSGEVGRLCVLGVRM
ncbi:hypothetical protein VC83_03054 [Pseudogymnoascus destructans]|uniref:Uncharacterized protein n=1 Tax=Pseudogymnoascus destructans TaxID=655981 RepID=A0A177AFQ0_9PEZI|nr:uncharacterized protein VC83_03054 [Pseudogymnoascus destructans]OAF60003.2 hypothetical protein VC83_03054 [Pseudogymnoascus destructans]